MNLSERVLGPFEIWLSESDSLDERAVMVNGLQTMVSHLQLLRNTFFTRFVLFTGNMH